MAPGRRPVLAIVDADEVRKRVGTASMSSATIEERIRKTCSQPDRLTVVLLENNLETVIEGDSRLRSAQDARRGTRGPRRWTRTSTPGI
jgi:hypothetical protein